MWETGRSVMPEKGLNSSCTLPASFGIKGKSMNQSDSVEDLRLPLSRV